VEALTDNINRTRPEISKIFEQNGGKIGAGGAVLWMFKRRGLILVKTDKVSEEKLMDLALNAGADDMTTEGDFYEILTPPDKFDAVQKLLEAEKIPTEAAEVKFLADNEPDADVATGKKVLS